MHTEFWWGNLTKRDRSEHVGVGEGAALVLLSILK